jgi:predicted enzyme related to lactoylglutathione lyase
MPERDGYIPGVPCWVDTSQPDPTAAAAFYGGLFGWEVRDVMPAESEGSYLVGEIRGGGVAAISPIPEDAPPMAVWNTYIDVASADAIVGKVVDAGGKTLAEPFDVEDAGRMAVFADPEGAVFGVWEAKKHKGAQVVNEAGALNFNGLNTRDVAGAKAFYGSVFGWSTTDIGGAEMWTLPGYGDHLGELTPGLRKQFADSGGPEGFIDVVAMITVLGDDQADVPAHWSVTFGTDDADASAAKAAELGGTVIVAPFDAPWVRMAVLADPAGATFIASQFVPENRDLDGQPDAQASAA